MRHGLDVSQASVLTCMLCDHRDLFAYTSVLLGACPGGLGGTQLSWELTPAGRRTHKRLWSFEFVPQLGERWTSSLKKAPWPLKAKVRARGRVAG